MGRNLLKIEKIINLLNYSSLIDDENNIQMDYLPIYFYIM